MWHCVALGLILHIGIFSSTTNTIAYRSKKPYKIWNQVISDTLKRKPLRQTAKMARVSTTTVFAWRHKIQATLDNENKDIYNQSFF